MAKRITFSFLLGFLCFYHSYGQYSYEKGKGDLYLEKHYVGFNLLTPSFEWEFVIGKNQTASTTLGLALATVDGEYSFSPSYNVKYRYYHNIKNRVDSGKNVSGNSANYIAASFTHFFLDYQLLGNMSRTDGDLIFLGAVYGLNRTFKNGIRVGGDVGLGYYFRDRVSHGIGPAIHFNFGWTPTRKKKKKIQFR